MDDLLKKAAELRGMPESLVERSAQARAKKEGIPVEQVLAEWAGVEPSTVAAAEAPQAPAAEPEPAEEPGGAARAESTEAEAAQPEEEAAPRVEVLAPSPEPDEEAAPGEAPAVEGEEEEFAVVAGRNRYPTWLTAFLVVIPLLAAVYIVALPNGPQCGNSGQLAIDPVTGVAVNCDGSSYGVVVVNNFSSGQALFADHCAVCHGATGGGGAGPALAGGSVLVTFPQGRCSDHKMWVTLGTAGWGATVGPTYGAPDKPVGGFGIMPGFGSGGAALSETQIAQVVIYERVQFGGESVTDAEADCLPSDTGTAALGS